MGFLAKTFEDNFSNWKIIRGKISSRIHNLKIYQVIFFFLMYGCFFRLTKPLICFNYGKADIILVSTDDVVTLNQEVNKGKIKLPEIEFIQELQRNCNSGNAYCSKV